MRGQSTEGLFYRILLGLPTPQKVTIFWTPSKTLPFNPLENQALLSHVAQATEKALYVSSSAPEHRMLCFCDLESFPAPVYLPYAVPEYCCCVLDDNVVLFSGADEAILLSKETDDALISRTTESVTTLKTAKVAEYSKWKVNHDDDMQTLRDIVAQKKSLYQCKISLVPFIRSLANRNLFQ